jgi:hypothetical protein
MAKINLYIPEPREPYTVDNFRQINQVLETLQNQLNTTFQEDLNQVVDRNIWFSMRSGNGC